MDYQWVLLLPQHRSMDNTLLTVLYADIFDYPLTREELNRWMIFDTRRVAKSSKEFFFLSGRQRIVATRKERTQWQKEKWDTARRAASIVSRIPTVLLIGVTGGLAMNNARREDDIDFYLVVEDGTLWMTRFLATVLLDMMHLRRRPNDVAVANKICLNMVVTKRGMGIPDVEQDLFSAHEVLQMQPVFERESTYGKFLSLNSWVRTYLPNAWHYRTTI
jgi:hypothetical protein